MNNFYVYQLRLSGEDKPFYIGKGKDKRSEGHFKEHSLKHASYKNHVIKKALRDGVEVLSEIIHRDLTEADAYSKEHELIAFYGRHNFGGCLTNVSEGGVGGNGRYTRTPEIREKIGAANRGKKPSEESRAKMSESQKRRYAEGAVGANAGRKLSEEWKHNIAKSMKGKPSRNAGKKNPPRSDESKKKSSEALKRYWDSVRASKISGSQSARALD